MSSGPVAGARQEAAQPATWSLGHNTGMPSSGMSESVSSVRTAVTSPQRVRDLNRSLLLELFWDAPADVGLTASELVDKTGLTRATVLAICDDLRDLNWVSEDRAPYVVPGRGRQARRFTFNRARRLVAASDVGVRSVTSVVADLKGIILGRAQHVFEDDGWEMDRTTHLMETFEEALATPGVARDQISEACIGIAAPVDLDGMPFPGNPYWDLVRIDLNRVLEYAPGWSLCVENDADLAAFAELHAAGADSASPSVTLLAAERLGAGIRVNGDILRGANGGAGELDYLARVDGAGSSLGITALARDLAHEAMAERGISSLWGCEEPSFAQINRAASTGDVLASTIVRKIEDHLAVAILTLSNLIAPAVVIIAGGAAELAVPIIPQVQSRLAETLSFPPTVKASTLGRDVVLHGATQRAIARVRSGAASTWERA